jgi:hypothetical protein
LSGGWAATAGTRPMKRSGDAGRASGWCATSGWHDERGRDAHGRAARAAIRLGRAGMDGRARLVSVVGASSRASAALRRVRGEARAHRDPGLGPAVCGGRATFCSVLYSRVSAAEWCVCPPPRVRDVRVAARLALFSPYMCLAPQTANSTPVDAPNSEHTVRNVARVRETKRQAKGNSSREEPKSGGTISRTIISRRRSGPTPARRAVAPPPAAAAAVGGLGYTLGPARGRPFNWSASGVCGTFHDSVP